MNTDNKELLFLHVAKLDEMIKVLKEDIACNGFSNLEAAHIMPQSHNGSFLLCNDIAMSRDMHCVFDKGFFMIEDDYTIIVHPDVLRTGSYPNECNGQKIFCSIN